jgi:hypothetical protein
MCYVPWLVPEPKDPLEISHPGGEPGIMLQHDKPKGSEIIT